MFGAMFSWWGLVITAIAVAVILAIAYVVVRGVVRFILRRRRSRGAESLAASIYPE